MENLAHSMQTGGENPQLIVLNEMGRSHVRAMIDAMRNEYNVRPIIFLAFLQN